jgi:outer membrane biosynthesis protein TonB
MINKGLVQIWASGNGSTSDLIAVSDKVRTNETGDFRVSIPRSSVSGPYKVVLTSDSDTEMQCDIRPGCRTAWSSGSVAFGEWFWPGNDLKMVTVVDPANGKAAPAVLTPLGTLAYQMIESRLSSGGLAGYPKALAELERKFDLAEGVLSGKQLDLSRPLPGDVTEDQVQSALLNTGFLQLVEDSRWNTLGQVINSFNSKVTVSGSVPESAGVKGLDESRELLLLASVIQAESHSQANSAKLRRLYSSSGQQLQELAASLVPSSRLQPEPSQNSQQPGSSKSEPETQPAPAPKPESAPEPEPAPSPEPDSTTAPKPEPAPAPEPKSEPAPEPAPTPEPDSTTAPEPAPEPAPTPEPDSTTAPEPDPTTAPDSSSDSGSSKEADASDGIAKLSWEAPLTRVNGDAMKMGEIAGYKLRYGQTDKVSEMTEEAMLDGQTMAHELTELEAGTWYFTIATLASDGLQSEWSKVVQKAIQ